MNLIKILKSAYAAVKDPERDFVERVFLVLTLVSEVTVFIALIGDIAFRENPREIIVLIATLIFVPLIVLVSLYFNKLKLAIRFIVICLVVAILPALFFFGGGVEGGGVIWIIFAFMYVGLVLRGRWRNIMFLLITILSLVCFLISYYHAEYVYDHTRAMFFADSFISLVLVGILCFVMTWVQGRIFSEENERAKKEAERAEELTRAQNRFFSSMSHEIRTPINSILGLNELILRDQEASEDIVRDASGIQGSGKMLLALINDILDFSKIEAGSMDIVPVDYKVGDMLSEIVNMMWLRAHDKELGFEVSVDPEVPMVLYGDEVRIKQIIINLLNNAVKYTSKGHVELRVESKDIDEDIVELGISVSDTGMGIKKEDIPFLFDAFKRVDAGKNRHIEGTGLGLSIVKQLVELMDGTISVNSVYGEGSTFTVTIRQMVSDHGMIGELNIHNQQMVGRSAYESSFMAPEVRILIVDDNEMNLEVESRLLADTDMGIDKAISGKEALEMCLKAHYDAIFMDHLMPGMNGIECLEHIRGQQGGLNRNTPVIVLTANAGSENRALYNQAGFDGYLVKPVSGEAMEEVLIQHISREKVILRNMMMGNNEDIHASDKYAEKVPVIIASSSMCDLPDSVIKKLNIPIIPCSIKTDDGVFKDGIHVDANELIRYMTSGGEAVSSAPDEYEYTEFFAEVLKRTHHIIYISITSSTSDEYRAASEAAKAFDNVSVINSECLSSATGLLVLIAHKLVQQGLTAEEIVSELEEVKHRLKCSFVIDTTEYIARKGLISNNVRRIADALNLHPALRLKNNKVGIGGLWVGRTKRAYKKYIRRALPVDTIPDSDVAFVTYVDVPEETLLWIEEEIRKTAYFEHIVFGQASAAISSNCGPGTFGILYFLKSNKSYNIASYIDGAKDTSGIPDEDEAYVELAETGTGEVTRPDEDTQAYTEQSVSEEQADNKWYEKLTCLDCEAALKNNGSEETFKTVLRIFYDSIPEKRAELDNCFNRQDWENYTIKIHALKSSARLIGAVGLGENAALLETAGKEDDIQYIMEHHEAVMEEYQSFMDGIAPAFAKETESSDADKPVADDVVIKDFYEGIRMAASAMDYDMLTEIIGEMNAFSIPDPEKEKIGIIRRKADNFDYDGIMEVTGDT